jgi:membrane fusion protein, copper/silver efflux system
MENKKLKKFLTYLVMIITGLMLGWFIFGRSGNDQTNNDHDHTEMTGSAAVEFTCSMHPQVRQDEPGDCPICGMDLIPVGDDDDDLADDPFLMTLSERQYTWANIRTQRVEAGTTEHRLVLTGKVAVNERNTRLITATFPGRIENLYADYTGRYIRRGERLASIYSPELMQAQQELIQAAAQKESNPRLYEAIRNRLKLFNLTQDQINAIEKSAQAVPNMDIYASVSGYLTQRAVSEGDYVNTGQTLFEIADLGSVWVELDAYEQQIGQIRQGDRAQVQIPAQRGAAFSGKVEFVDPFLNPQTRTARIRLTVANPDMHLKPEMFVNATIMPGDAGMTQPVVPHTAVLWTGERSVVYVKIPREEGFTFEYREIETGSRLEDGYQVLSGLEAGEEIAVHGVFAIDAAAQLAGKPSMMQRPESKTMDVPQAFRNQITAVASAYFNVKNALVNDNAETAREEAGKITGTLGKVDMGLLEGDAHHLWMTLQEQLEEAAKMISETTDIEKQREHFNMLSEAILETTESFGLEIDRTYRLFCPMAFDDEGAYWLSESERILNPYFGDMMLRCGEVKQTYRKGQRIFKTENNQNTQPAGHNH